MWIHSLNTYFQNTLPASILMPNGLKDKISNLTHEPNFVILIFLKRAIFMGLKQYIFVINFIHISVFSSDFQSITTVKNPYRIEKSLS